MYDTGAIALAVCWRPAFPACRAACVSAGVSVTWFTPFPSPALVLPKLHRPVSCPAWACSCKCVGGGGCMVQAWLSLAWLLVEPCAADGGQVLAGVQWPEASAVQPHAMERDFREMAWEEMAWVDRAREGRGKGERPLIVWMALSICPSCEVAPLQALKALKRSPAPKRHIGYFFLLGACSAQAAACVDRAIQRQQALPCDTFSSDAGGRDTLTSAVTTGPREWVGLSQHH